MKKDNTVILIGLVVIAFVITVLCLISTQQHTKRTEHMKSVLELYNRSKRPYRRTENMTMIDDTRNKVADAIDGVSDKLGDFKETIDGFSESVRPAPAA
jgi:archaellum component FlaC